MEKLLRLMINVDGGAESTPFPNADNPIEIGAFRYDAKRMGGAPTITASVNYPTCLDNEWTDNVYATFNGEKYYLKQTPTSSYNNESTMYKHDLELVSERVNLDNVYFFDTVVGDPQGDDKPVSNSTKVVFFGNIDEFVARLNSSLEYSGLDYTVVVDDDDNITKEEKLMSFEDQFFSNVLQEIYNTYEVPYYFDGKTIHIGWAKDDVVIPTLEYGVDNALLSITKNNANYKIVNRATGTGSSDNIPFYYPNNSPKGEIAATSSNANVEVTILDTELYSNEVKLDGVITRSNIDYENLEVEYLGESIYSGETFSAQMGYGGISKDFFITFDAKDVGELSVSFASKVTKYTLKDVEINDATLSVKYYMSLRTPSEDGYPFGREVFTSGTLDSVEDVRIPIVKALDGYRLKITVSYATTGKYAGKGGRIVFDASFDFGSESGWTYEGKPIELKDVGLKAEGTPSVGDTITQTLVKYVKTSQNLMPYRYRVSSGDERFYNAINYPYPKPEGFDDTLLNGYYGEDGILRNPLGEYEVEGYIHNDAYKNEDETHIHFNAPYVEGRPKEHIITVEDIKPTIKETMVNSLRIDMFSEFAYDTGDNDETYEDEEGNVYFKHPYFYGKLRVMDFNLFDHAIEQQPMTISFTSGHCGACNFEIGVTEDYPQKNPVQVDEDGNLVRDENGMVLAGVEGTQQLVTTFQERQQDTSKYEVWIALRKEEETYGILMPQVAHRPKAAKNEDGTLNNDGDTFVILGINLPQSYILNAEKRLEAEIIKYIKDNNEEKFTFSIGFSRIYFAENETVLNSLSENSKIRITYDNKPYDLYVSSFSYNMSEGDVLPDIRVELDDTLKVSQNALQKAVNQVKSELGKVLGNIDVVGAATPYFIRKDADDEARGTIDFKKGVKFGEGGKVEVLDNNSAKLTIEYLEVTKKASFTSLEIQEKTHVGGQILVTPAAINCGEVEEFDDYYRCYFQTKGTDGDEIFNQFATNDQAICQTFNTWGSRYYWRKVVGIGEDYIDLSKVEGEYDEDSDAPMAGDKIIQLGNQTDTTRQNAIVIAAYGDGSPYIIQYKGINAFEIPDDKIVTKLSSTENIFTGKVHMELGSDGLDQLPEWIEVRDTANEALEKAGSIGEEAFAELEAYIDNVRQELQEQIDGAVDSYFEDYEPSTFNYPANAWSEEEKEAHLNDTFTNLTDGRSWRWSKSAGVYTWVEIADTATSEALKIAGQAKDAADKKIRMFVEQPYPPYSVGDLWSRGEEAPLMRCINAKDSGAFDEADWGLADNSQAYTDEAVGNIKLGGDNLLRNSGFTGDYLSERIADDSVLEATDELYSAPLDHWNSSNATVVDSDETVSGKAVSLTSGEISQELYYNIVAGEQYTISFKAQGSGSISCTVADVTISVPLTEEWTKYERVVTVNEAINAFRISNATCTLGDLKLESGNRASTWKPSFLDNSSDRAYWQSMKYMQSALKGATDVNGGLVLTEMIQVGDYDEESKTWRKRNGGMSGIYENDNDVAFWAGGNFEQAVATVMKYVEDPTYQPTEEELASMVQFVVTHGGRAILNEAIVRGTIYANDGKFTGTVNATSGVFNNVDVQTGKIADFDIQGSHLGIQEELGGDGMFLYNQYIGFRKNEDGYKRESIVGDNVLPSLGGITALAKFENTTTDSYESIMGTGYGVISNVSGYKNSYAFASEKGVFAGLRPNVTILGSDNSPLQLGKYDHTVLALYGGRIILDSNPENGQEYEFILPYTSASNGNVEIVNISEDKKNIYLMHDGAKRAGFSPRDLGGTRQTVKMVYFAQDDTWYAWYNLY